MPTPSSGSPERALDEALARGVLYRAVTLGLQRPSPSAAWLLTESAGVPLIAAAAQLDAGRLSAEPLRPAVEALAALAIPATADLSLLHARLFGHAQGRVSPFETDYGLGADFRQPQELADIAGTYLAFGLGPATGRDERADHVGCECEFMDFLARKEAFLLGCLLPRDAEGLAQAAPLTPAEAEPMLDTVRSAARGFLRDHLGRFGRAFAARLLREDEGGFYGAVAALLFRLLGADCERRGIAPGSPTLELRPPTVDDTPLACGSCALEPARLTIPRREHP